MQQHEEDHLERDRALRGHHVLHPAAAGVLRGDCLPLRWGLRGGQVHIALRRTVLDITCWVYLVAVVVGYISCKVFYLLWAWKFPEWYLRHRQVII